MKVIIPENLFDITLDQFKKYSALNKREGVSDLEYNKRAISIFTNLPYQSIEKIAQKDYEGLVLQIAKALETDCEFEYKFKLDGICYGFIPNLDEMTQAEWMDLCEYQTEVKNLNKLMAVLFRPILKEDAFGNYKIEPYNGTADRAGVFNKMPMNIVNGALGFFLNLGNQLRKNIQKSTAMEAAKEVKLRTFLKSGDGMLQSMN